MKVSTLSLVAAALLGLSQAAIAETKIGFVNSDRVMREAAPAVRAQQRGQAQQREPDVTRRVGLAVTQRHGERAHHAPRPAE